MSVVALGSLVRDVITGLEGIVMGRTEYLTGCAHVGIQPRHLTKDGGIPDWQWIDERRVVVLEPNAVRVTPSGLTEAQPQGGPAPNAPSM